MVSCSELGEGSKHRIHVRIVEGAIEWRYGFQVEIVEQTWKGVLEPRNEIVDQEIGSLKSSKAEISVEDQD